LTDAIAPSAVHALPLGLQFWTEIILCSYDVRFARSATFSRMPSLTTLPPELWFVIAEYLDLGDLLTLYDTFESDIQHADVHTISRTLADNEFYNILAKWTARIQVFVTSNERAPPPPPFQRRQLRFYSHSPVKVERSLTTTFDSGVKLTFSTDHLENVRPYVPEFHGEQLVQISQVNICFSTDSNNQKDDHRLRLYFLKSQAHLSHQTSFENPPSAPLVCATTRGLQFHSAMWIRHEPITIFDLPKSYFSVLGNSITGSTTFSKEDPRNPHPPDEPFTAPRYYLNSISLSFEDFSLPASSALQHLLPSEIVPPETSTQN